MNSSFGQANDDRLDTAPIPLLAKRSSSGIVARPAVGMSACGRSQVREILHKIRTALEHQDSTDRTGEVEYLVRSFRESSFDKSLPSPADASGMSALIRQVVRVGIQASKRLLHFALSFSETTFRTADKFRYRESNCGGEANISACIFDCRNALTGVSHQDRLRIVGIGAIGP